MYLSWYNKISDLYEYNITCTDMARKYKLNHQGFSSIHTGKRKTYHGWVCLNPDLT